MITETLLDRSVFQYDELHCNLWKEECLENPQKTGEGYK